MSSADYAEWIAYQQLEPTLGERLDILFARLMWLVASMMRDKNSPKLQVSEFVPDWDPKSHTKKPNYAAMFATMQMGAAVHNAVIAANAKR